MRPTDLASCTPELPSLGYSTYCIRGEHVTCDRIGVVTCACPLHKGQGYVVFDDEQGEAMEPPIEDTRGPTDEFVVRQLWYCREPGCEDLEFRTGQKLGAHRRLNHSTAKAPSKVRTNGHKTGHQVPGPVSHWVLAVPHHGDVKLLVVTDFDRMQDLNGFLKVLGHAVFVLEVRGHGE